MNTSTRAAGRTLWVAIRAMVVATLALGVGYTLVITLIGQFALPAQANGSLLESAQGQIVGSALIGQSFTDAAGDPLPQYFQSRPSAAGDGDDPTSSSGSNLGPENPELAEGISELKAQIAAFDGVSEDQVPADAVTASGSGLDPDISPAYAAIQIARVAAARQMPVSAVQQLVAAHTQPPDLGYLGEAAVNVVSLNLALDEWKG